MRLTDMQQAEGNTSSRHGTYQWPCRGWCYSISFRLCRCSDYYYSQVTPWATWSHDLLQEGRERSKQARKRGMAGGNNKIL
jgi:hypothetical protein